MDFNALIAELRAASENLPKDSVDRSLLSSVYCNKACTVLDQIAENTDYDNIITGLWLVAAHFAEQLSYLKPVPALSELCFKLFRQCAKAVLNIQWQNLEEDSSLRQNFLASLANLHAKLVPLDFPRFRLLEGLTENPWTNPTLAKVMGGEVEDNDKEEVRCYIEQEDPIILQLRVDMMLKENCEEYALNLCNSCLSHPELQSDLGVRKTQLSLLYKLGQEDKLQEECQKLNIQDAVRIIKQLQTSKTHRQICTVLAQTFMVQNWIRPSDMEANKELLRLWIRHQLLVDREQDQFKESVWAMAKLSQSTEQIIIFIDVLREECGETFLQLYMDMCIFAINVDKGQMETNKKEGNLEAAAARRSDMASICAKLSCLCHHASVKVARICALTSFALKPTEQSFTKIGTFYGQGTDCCNKCGRDRNREPGTVNPATLYEVERLLNMLRPDYLSPDQSYVNIQILCRRFLQESLKNAQQLQRKQFMSQNTSTLPSVNATQVDGPGNKLPTATSCRPTNVFEALSPQDFQNTQILLNKMRLQNLSPVKPSMPVSSSSQQIYQSGTSRSIVQPGQQSNLSSAGQTNKPQYMFDAERVKNKQPYGVPLEQQHQYYLIKHEKELEQRRKNAQKKREEKTQQNINVNSQMQQQMPQLLQQQQRQQQREQLLKQQHNEQVTQIIHTALKQDSNALQKLTQGASPGVVQAVLNIMKGTMLKQSSPSTLQQQQSMSQQVKPTVSSSQYGTQPLPTVSTLLKPSLQAQQLQKHHEQQQQHKQQEPHQPREHSPPRRHPRPQLYAQPIIVSTSSNATPMKYQSPSVTMINSRNQVTQSSTLSSASSVEDKQKADNLMLTKSHVEDIRQFMHLQMSNLQQKQIAEPRQMSGSTVTLTNMSANSPGHASFNLTNRPKTTVELAEQAALAKLQKQENSKSGIYPQSQQLKSNSGQTFTCQAGQMFPKPNQQQFIPSTSRANTDVHLHSPQHQQHPKSLHLQQQNNTFSFQQNQSSCLTPNSVLPSSDELSGSIMGIDDTIIKELLEDSGILANTFPDIEVDTITEDKSRKVPDFTSLPQSIIPPNSNQMPKSSKPQLYCYSTPTVPQTYTIQSTQGHSATKISHSQNVVSASYHHHHPVSGINKYPTLRAPTSSTSSMSQSNLNKPLMNQSALNTFSGPNNQVPSSPQLWSNSKMSVPPRDNISVLPKKDMKQEAKPTVDQLREMMKKEDIQGEIYMDAANNATYRCIICSFAFETLDHLREHVRNVCKPGLQSSSVYTTKIKQDRANSAKAGVETTTVFQCLRCFELCVSDAGIKQHRLTCKRVPTVPSDLKKEAPINKLKTLPKPTVMKQSQKKEQLDNSYKVPDLPLPFPYPSLNADAVLKSMSMAGSFISQTHGWSQDFGSKPHPPVLPGEVTSRSIVSAPTPFSSVSSTTSVSDSKYVPVSSSATSCNTTQSPATASSSNVNAVNQNPTPLPHTDNSSIYEKDPASLPQNETLLADTVEAKISLVERDLNLQDVDKLTTKENPEIVSPQRYTEITGSGGSKFYKCGICSQTLCSMESFLVHWEECAVKNKSLLRKLELKEMASNAKPITGEVLENLLAVIAVVAVGNGSIPDTISSDSEWCDVDDLYSLRDPCKARSLDGTGSSDDTDSASSYETEGCDSQESMYDTDDVADGRRDGRDTGCVNNVDEFTDRNDGQEKYSEEGLEEEEEDNDDKIFKNSRRKFSEDTEDDADSMSDSQQSYVSTREVPPKLRDRKTLRPIHSFINESFTSSFVKSNVKPTSAKFDEKLKETTGDEKTSSESEVESDGDSLYCKVCQASYQTKRILLQHFAGKHLKPYTVKTVADSSSYFCHLCQKTFSTFMHYMQHVPNHSVTIYEKMRAFISSRKSAQRSERIASQRGLAKRNSIIPKINKTFKSTRAATKSVEQLNQQLLADKTQSMRERLRISKRKRSLPSTFTSSDDDYSSDASNNVVFKSKKSTEIENWSDGQKPITRSRNAVRQKSQSHHKVEDSSTQSSLDHSGEENDRGPRLAKVRDDDYIVSDDFDSEGADTNTPPTTRSRKRYVQRLRLSNYKRRKISYDSEPNEEIVQENDNQSSKKHLCDSNLSDSDVDSNCSALLLSQCQNGKFVPSNNKPDAQGESCESSNIQVTAQSGENGREPVPTRVLFVRSLTKQQKEKLNSCDLHPTVVLETLCLDNLETSLGYGIHSAGNTPDVQTPSSLDKQHVSAPEAPENSTSSETSTSAAIKTRNSSFLDSFLSYLNQYPSSEEAMQSEKKRSKSGPPGVKGSHKISSSCDLSQISEPSQSPTILSSSSSTETEMPESICETVTSNSNIHSCDNSQDTVQNILLQFPTRRCSVNLGQKLSLEDLQTNKNVLSHNKGTTQDTSNASATVSAGHKERPDISNTINVSPSKSAHVITDVKQIPVVCLERNDKIDLYATKPLVSTTLSVNEKFNCKSIVSESKPVEQKKLRDGTKDNFRTNSHGKGRNILKITTDGSSYLCVSSDSAIQASNLSADLKSQLCSDVVKVETMGNTLAELDTVEGVINSLHSKQENSTRTEITCSDLKEEVRAAHFASANISPVSGGTVDVVTLPKLEDDENPGIISGNTCCGSGCHATKCEDKVPDGCLAAQNDCNIVQMSSINDCDELSTVKTKTTENVKKCVSENIIETCSQVSAQSVALNSEERSLVADVPDIPCSTDSLATSDTSQGCRSGVKDTDLTKFTLNSQNRNLLSNSVEMTYRHQTEHDSTDIAFIEAGKSQNFPLNNCKEQDRIPHVLGQCETTEIRLQNCSTFQIGYPCINSEGTVEQQQFTNEMDSEKPKTQEQQFTGVKDSEKPKTQEQQFTDVKDSEKPKTQEQQFTNEMDSEKPKTQEQQFTDVKDSEKPKTQEQQFTDVMDSEKPKTQEQQFTDVKDSEKPKIQSIIVGSLQAEHKLEQMLMNTKILDNSKAHSIVVAENLETKLKVEEADLLCSAVKSSSQFMPQDLQQCGTSLAVTEILEKVNAHSLDRTDFDACISDIDSTVDIGKTCQTHLRIPGNCESLSKLEDQNMQANISIQNQDFEISPVSIKGYKEYNESSHARDNTENSASVGAAEEFEKIPDGQNSTVVNGDTKEVTGKHDNRSLNVKQSSISRDKYVLVPVADQHFITANEKSIGSDNSITADLSDASKKNRVLPTRDGSSVGLKKLNETPRKQDNKARVILNPSISLAAFIAERLTKEDLEPLSRLSQAQRVTVRQLDQDSPLDIGNRSQIYQNYPLDNDNRSQFYQDSLLDNGKCSQIYQDSPLDNGKCSQICQDPSMDIGKCSQIGQDSSMDIGKCSQIGQDSSMDIGKCSQIGQDSSMDIGKCSQIGQDSFFDVGKCSQIGQDSVINVGCCITEPACITLTKDNNPQLEIGCYNSDNVKLVQTSQSSCLVDYSSSESEEEQLQRDNEPNVDDSNRISVQGFEIGELCIDENKTCMEAIRHNVSDTLQTMQLDKANCIHSATISVKKDGQLQELGGGKVCVGIQDKEIGFELPGNQIDEASGHCLLQCNVPKQKQLKHEYAISQGHSKPIREEHSAGLEQSRNWELFESLLENIPDRSRNESGRSENQVAEKNFITPLKSNLTESSADKLLGNKTQVIPTKTDENLKTNALQCAASLVGRGNYQKSLPKEKINEDTALLTGESESELPQKFVNKSIDIIVRGISNEGNETKSGKEDRNTTLKTRTLFANKPDGRHEFTACGGFKENESIPGKQSQRWGEKTVINGVNLITELSEYVDKDVCEVVSQASDNIFRKNKDRDLSCGGSVGGHYDLPEESVQGRICDVALEATGSKLCRENETGEGKSQTKQTRRNIEEKETKMTHDVYEGQLLPSAHTDPVVMKDNDYCTMNIMFTSYDQPSESTLYHSSQDILKEIQATTSIMNQTKNQTNLDKKTQLGTQSTHECEYENSMYTHSERIFKVDHSPTKKSNTDFKKLDDLVVAATERKITLNDLSAAVPERAVFLNSQQQQLSTFEGISVVYPGTSNNIVDLCSRDTNLMVHVQSQLSGDVNVPTEKVEYHLKERDSERDSLIAESVSGAVNLDTEVELNQDQFGGNLVIGQMETYSESDGTLNRSYIDINKGEGSCISENDKQICEDSCIGSQITGHIKSEVTTETKNSEEMTSQRGSSSNIVDGSRSETLHKPDSPSERRNTDNETDEGDDFSDFDLVIEDDTSYRRLSFPITLEEKRYTPVTLHSSSSYSSKGKINYSVSSVNTTPTSGLLYNRVQDHHSSLGHQPNTALRNPHACAKTLRKSIQGQFVWDTDDDADSYRNKLLAGSPNIPLTSSAAFKNVSFVSKVVTNPALEALNRKQKALREKTETAPFTWDLEDFTDNSIGGARDYLTVKSSSKLGNDILSFDTSSLGHHRNISVGKANRKIRPLTPDVSHGKMPAKFRRTSSVDRQTKNSSALVGKELKRQQKVGVKCENEASNICRSSKDPVEKLSNNSITVDDEVSFKIDPFSAPLCVISSADRRSPQTGSLICSSGIETKLRRERSQKHHVTPQPVVAHHDEKFENPCQSDDVESFKNLPGLRSRHSSMESDKSATSKRSSDGISQTTHKRLRKSEDPLSPKLKKIGLIKINKESHSPPAPSGADCTAPVTRSSEAAIKAFNQKSLRSRGVNPVHSQQTAAKILPQITPPKSSPDSSCRLKTSISVQKLSPLSSNIVRNSTTEVKAEPSAKSSIKKSHHIDNATVAIVKRRSPTIPITTSGVVYSKAPAALRSRKSLTGRSKSHHTGGSTTIFRVDPLPGTKATYKSQVISTAKGMRTLHTPLPHGTTAVRPNKDTGKQPKWKIKKETKLCRGKKQQRGPLSFKRT